MENISLFKGTAKALYRWGTTYYCRVSNDSLNLVDINTSISYEDLPVLALQKIEKKQNIIAIGSEALGLGSGDITIVKPFEDCLFGSHFDLGAMSLLQHAILSILQESKEQKNFLRSVLSANLIWHPIGLRSDEPTKSQLNTFEKICDGAGIRRVFIVTGEELKVFDHDYVQSRALFWT